MEKNQRSIRARLGSRSVFLKIFISLMLFLAVLMLVVVFWINRISSTDQQRQILRSDISRIQSADRTVEQVLDDLNSNMTQVVWSQEFLSYAMLPMQEDQTKYAQLQKQLQNMARTTWVLRKAVFYSFGSGKLFQSDSSRVLEKDAYMDAWALAEDPMQIPECCASLFMNNTDRRTKTWLVTKGGRVLLRLDLTMQQKVSSILCELNTAVLSEIISNSNSQPSGNIYPYDLEGNPILPVVLNYPELQSGLSGIPEASVITEEKVDTYKVRRDTQVYLLQGERVPWQYMMQVSRENMQVSLSSTIRTWLPALGILLAASLLISFYVVRSIYRPINRLLSIASTTPAGERPSEETSPAGRSPRRSNNEFAVLEDAYSQAMDQQAHISQMLETVAPDILDHMLVNILSGRSYTTERIEGVLEGIGNPVPADGRFLLCTCVIAEPEDRTVTETEWNLYLISLQNMIAEFSGRGFFVHPLRMDRYTIVIFLSFPEDWSAVSIKKVFVEMQRTLMGNAEVLPYRLWVESSQIFSHLKNSREAYEEGLEKIRYRTKQEENTSGISTEKEIGVVSDGETAGTNPVERVVKEERNVRPDHLWCRKQVQETLALCNKGERTAAQLRLEQMAEEIKGSTEDMEELKRAYGILLEELIEKAVAYPLNREEQDLVEDQVLFERIRRAEDRETLQFLVLDRSREICQLIYSYNRKNRYKYVDQAKEFISEHYTDSGLALNDVAEHIGISASYLSELFAEISGDKFTSYLASYRVEQARRLLRSTSLPAKEIGTRCGFNSVQNFNRVFKKNTGLTPGQYRDSAVGAK